MKKTSYLLISLFIISFLYSCSKSPSELIVGKWKIADIKTSEEIPEDQKEMYEQTMSDMKVSSKMEFKADGSYERTEADSPTKGKWKISKDVKTLALVEENGEVTRKSIVELSENKLILFYDYNKFTTTWKKVK